MVGSSIAGTVFVPIDPRTRGKKLAYMLTFAECRGAIVGDYAKTAINTGIFTGKTVGCCSMLYGFVTTNVPSFVNYARSFGQVTEQLGATTLRRRAHGG